MVQSAQHCPRALMSMVDRRAKQLEGADGPVTKLPRLSPSSTLARLVICTLGPGARTHTNEDARVCKREYLLSFKVTENLLDKRDIEQSCFEVQAVQVLSYVIR